MKPLSTNLASRPFRNNVVLGSALGAVVALLVLATGLNLFLFLRHGDSYAELQRERASDAERLAKVEAEQSRLTGEIQERDFRRLQAQERIAAELILRRAFSWTLLFNELESVVPAEVMMTAIHPNITADGIIVRVDGVAKNSLAFLDLQDHLLANRAYARVSPISERRLNPSRPEITFALNFGYLPKVAAPVAVVASGPAAPPSATAGTNGPAPAPNSAPAPDAAPGSTTAAESAPEVAQASPTRAAAASSTGVVGRNGLPRAEAALARMIAAPGALYLPPGFRPPAPAAATEPGSKPKDPAREGGSGGKRPRAAGRPPATPAGAGASTQPPARLLNLPLRGEPGMPAGLQPGALPPKARLAAEIVRSAVPAARLDLPMQFSDRPVGEIYDALAKAHGVRFEIDPGVDRSARVTVDLSGKTLADAIAVVTRAAGHRVSRKADGLYRVVLPAGGAAIADKPLQEETLSPAGGRP